MLIRLHDYYKFNVSDLVNEGVLSLQVDILTKFISSLQNFVIVVIFVKI